MTIWRFNFLQGFLSREDSNNDFFKRASIHLHVPEVRKAMLYQLCLYFIVVLQIPRVFRLTFYCNLFTAASCKMPRKQKDQLVLTRHWPFAREIHAYFVLIGWESGASF